MEDKQPVAANSHPGSKKQAIAALGIIIFLLSLGAGLYLSMSALQAGAYAVFQTMQPHTFERPLETMRCTALLTRREAGTVAAALDGTTGYYSVCLYAGTRSYQDANYRGQADVSDPGSTRGQLTPTQARHNECTSSVFTLTLPPGQTADLTWKVTVGDDAQAEYIALGLSARGRDTPGYTGDCGIALVEAFGLTAGQAVLLILAGMLLGGATWLYASWPLGRLGRAGFAIGGLLWIIVLWQLSPLRLYANDRILWILGWPVMPLLVLALLIILVISLSRNLRKPGRERGQR